MTDQTEQAKTGAQAAAAEANGAPVDPAAAAAAEQLAAAEKAAAAAAARKANRERLTAQRAEAAAPGPQAAPAAAAAEEECDECRDRRVALEDRVARVEYVQKKLAQMVVSLAIAAAVAYVLAGRDKAAAESE